MFLWQRNFCRNHYFFFLTTKRPTIDIFHFLFILWEHVYTDVIFYSFILIKNKYFSSWEKRVNKASLILPSSLQFHFWLSRLQEEVHQHLFILLTRAHTQPIISKDLYVLWYSALLKLQSMMNEYIHKNII